MKAFLSLASILMVVLGTGWLFLPETMLGLWGVRSDPVGVYMSQRYGSFFYGYAAVFWLARGSSASQARTAIFGGGALLAGIVALVSLYGVASSSISGLAAWGAIALEAVLAGGFLYFLVAARRV